MNRTSHRLSALLLALLFCATPLISATFIVPTDRQLIEEADAIAIGRVVSVTAQRHHSLGIVTVAQFEVDEWLKGRAFRSTLNVYEMGGEVDGSYKIVSGAARFHPGERTLLFLERGALGEWRVLNMVLGKFNFVDGANGTRLLMRGAEVDQIYGWTHAGKPFIEHQRLEREFIEYIRAVVAGFPVEEKHIVTENADAVSPSGDRISIMAANDYLMQSGSGGFRWQVFDTNGTITYLTNGTQTGMPDSLGAVDRGMNAWNSDPNSSVSMVRGGTTSIAAPDDDGTNVIIFNYNGPEWTSNPGAIGLGTVNANAIYPHNGETFVRIFDGDVIIKVGTVIPQTDFDGLLAHELGHTIGFRHSDQGTPSSSNAIMRSVLVNGLGANRTQWDTDAVQSVYGAGVVCNAPTISSHPASPTIESGNTATLSVTASASQTITYQWYQGTSGVTTTPVGTNSSSFTTPPLTATTSYWVRVSACSPAQSTNSNTATVTVTTCTAPVISQQPFASPASVNPGGTANLFVSSSSSGVTYQWYSCNGGASNCAGNLATSTAVPGGTSTQVSVNPSATTTYWVRLSRCAGAQATNSQPVTVTVVPCEAPVINATTPADADIVTGGTATLTVLHGGTTPATYQWYQGPAGQVTTPVGSNSPSFTTPPLTVQTQYWVRVTNCGGSRDSRAATVRPAVCTAPQITTQPQSTSVQPGGSATLSVAATGTSLVYQWYRGQSGDQSNPVSGATSASLNTGTLQATTSFWVKVTSNCGALASVNSQTATVNVNPCSISITQQPQSTSGFGGTSATLRVTATGAPSNSTLTYQWYRGVAGQPATPIAGATSSTFNTGPLTATTSYFVRITSNCGGSSTTSVDSATATVTVNVRRSRRPGRRR